MDWNLRRVIITLLALTLVALFGCGSETPSALDSDFESLRERSTPQFSPDTQSPSSQSSRSTFAASMEAEQRLDEFYSGEAMPIDRAYRAAKDELAEHAVQLIWLKKGIIFV